MALYKKELGRILKSFTYIIMVLGLLIHVSAQGVFLPDEMIEKPQPGGVSYGMKKSGDPALIMPEAASSLFGEFSANRYLTYPNGFAKYVKLGAVDRDSMRKIIEELSVDHNVSRNDLSNADINQEEESIDDLKDKFDIQVQGDDLIQNLDGSFEIKVQDKEGKEGNQGYKNMEFQFDSSISWERFCELMLEADDLLGGGSDYSETWMSHRFGEVPLTYEEALEDYELVLTKDRLTGAHGRLFSDYMGIILGLIPIFPVVFLCLKDQKNIAPMIYTRDISSIQFILTRFIALITAVMIPVFVMCGILTVIHGGDYGWSNIDVLAYFKYAIIWQLPTAMMATAVGLFFTTATNTPVAIAIQLVWWFVNIMGGNGSYSFFGIQPLGLIPRHNALGKTQAYLDYLPQLIQNRIIIGLGALVLVVLTIFIFSAKRRGLLHVNLRKRSKIQPEI